MDATPINTGDSTPFAGNPLGRAGRAQFGTGSASALGMKWSALHDAAGAVAAIAGIEAPPATADERGFPAAIRDCEGWRRTLAEQGVADLSAIMEPGLTALLSAIARGANPRAAAHALYRDFVHSRDALMDLVPPRASRRMT